MVERPGVREVKRLLRRMDDFDSNGFLWFLAGGWFAGLLLAALYLSL